MTEPVDLEALEKDIRSGVDPEVGYYRDRYSSAILAIIAELRELRAWKERLGDPEDWIPTAKGHDECGTIGGGRSESP